MATAVEPKTLPGKEPAPSGEPGNPIVTKLAQFVQFSQQVQPAIEVDPGKAVQQLATLAHSLVEEIGHHLAKQDRRIAELENLATTDGLTNVLNRRGFEDRLTHELSVARRHGVGGVLIFVDLDEFKPINDTYGHAAGDEVLVTVANLLRAHIRDTDYIGRLGGDEFAILLPRSNKRNGVGRAEDLDRKLNNAYAAWRGHNIPIKASCGVYMYSSKIEMKELLENADAAMYQIKQERKTRLGIQTRT
ncbi:MAG: GGDEF domain-containing protein [Rhodospirillaceae bacterium]|nr:GGDEF domain-containing protein [Rhodospirillaceae bacterium]